MKSNNFIYLCIGTHKVRTSAEQIYAKIITKYQNYEEIQSWFSLQERKVLNLCK